jgi:hypothetical protein
VNNQQLAQLLVDITSVAASLHDLVAWMRYELNIALSVIAASLAVMAVTLAFKRFHGYDD